MFVFLHIPKSAGTTLCHVILDQHKARYSLYKVYWPEFWDPQAAAREFLKTPRAHQDALEVFYGHVNYGLHKYLPQPVTYYTVLREPVSRAISHYYYVLNRYILSDTLEGKPHLHEDRERALAGKLTLADYISSGYCEEMDNGQTRVLAGENGLFDRTPYGQCTPALLEEAKTNLRERVAVVGLTERFDESLLMIQRLCGWNTPYYVRQNVTQDKPPNNKIDATTMQIVRDWNRYDLELYAYGVQLFEEQVAKQGPNFAADVRRFQQQNRKYGPMVCQWNDKARTVRRAGRYLSDILTRRSRNGAVGSVT